MQKNITIVGAGLAGSLCALYLTKRGHHVSIFDRRKETAPPCERLSKRHSLLEITQDTRKHVHYQVKESLEWKKGDEEDDDVCWGRFPHKLHETKDLKKW